MPFFHAASEPVVLNRKLKKPIGYWEKPVAGALKHTALFTNHFYPEPDVPEPASVHFSIDSAGTNSLNQLSNKYNTHLPVILLSAFKLLVYRYTHQAEQVVNYPFTHYSTSNEKWAKPLRRICPIRTNFSENLTFINLLQQVQMAISAIANGKEALVAGTEINLPANREPLHSSPVIFSFRHQLELVYKQDRTTQNYYCGNQVYRAGLKLILENSAAGINGWLTYDKELYEAEAITGMANHYQVLLREIISDPAQRVAQIAIISQAERNKLLYVWNKTEAGFPHTCIHKLMEEQAQLTPQAIAVTLYPGIKSYTDTSARQMTYAELDERANQVAHFLQSQGVGPDVIVGIYMKRSLEIVVAILGILKAGGAYLPLDPTHPKDRLAFIVKDSGISILLSQHQLLPTLPLHRMQVTCLDADWNNIALHNHFAPKSQVNPKNLAYVIYTSGSTGTPKGTLITHRGVVNYLSWCIKTYKVNEGNGCPVNSSIGFDATVTSFFSPLLTGKKIMLLPEDGETEALANVLQSDNAFSLIKITPAHLEILNDLLPCKDVGGQVNALVIGGEALTGKQLECWKKNAPGTRLINEYGPTETVVGCCVYEVAAEKTVTGNVPVGRPIANTQIYILDSCMQPVPTGVSGEIYIGGAGVARGYLNRPELTAERFIPNPFSTDAGARLYKTGDLARYLPDGNIVFLGRADNQVKIRGYRIELGEIEHVLQQSELVKQAVVLVKEDITGGKRLTGYFVPHPAAMKLMEPGHYNQRVANWKALYENEYSQATANKTIDPEFNITGWNDSFTGQAIPATEMKEWLDDIVATILEGQPKNVLEIGCGTGLIYYQLASKVNKYIGSDLSASSILQMQARIQKQEKNYCNTELFTAPAHEVTLPQGWQPDTILLNSMVQYFPGAAYMDAVIKNCMAMVKDKGRIIIGDVRDYRLLHLFKSRLRLQKSPATLSLKDFKRAIDQDVLNEEELCFSPAYFYGLKEVYSSITHIDVRWKKAGYTNELSLYRYTVVLYVGIEKERADIEWQNWEDGTCNNNIFLASGLVENRIAIKNIPNPRLCRERLLQQVLQNEPVGTVGEIKQAIEIENRPDARLEKLLRIAEQKGYHPTMFVQEDPLKVNLLFELNPLPGFIEQPMAQQVQQANNAKTNSPLFTVISYSLQKDIRKMLLGKLPEYMVPSELIAIAELPLTKNGKIDRLFLKGMEERKTLKTADFKEPSTTEEKILAQIWMEILSVEQVSIYDDFFELGGNSLQAFRMFSKIRKAFGKNLSLGLLHKASTIEKLVQFLNEDTNVAAWRCLVPIQPLGSKPPIFCVHGGWGHVLFYRDLAHHLGTGQPFYGLQVKGLNGKDKPYYIMEDMAAHYIREIRSVQPAGPYYLGGYCYGIIVAFEMAQQLLQQGQQVALLANFNGVSPLYLFPENFIKSKKIIPPATPENTSLPDPGHKSLATNSFKQNHFLFKVKDRIRVPLRWGKAELKKYLLKLRKNIPWLPYKVAISFYLITGKIMPEQILKMYIFNAMGKAQGRYIPGAYPGEMVIFRSPKLFRESHLGWLPFVSGAVTTIDIAGEHAGRTAILHEPHVQLVADELKKYMNKYPGLGVPFFANDLKVPD